METTTVNFAGKDFEVLANAGNDFFALRAIVKAKAAPELIFDAYDVVFLGRTDEYAEALGRDFEMVSKLYALAVEGEQKN